MMAKTRITLDDIAVQNMGGFDGAAKLELRLSESGMTLGVMSMDDEKFLGILSLDIETVASLAAICSMVVGRAARANRTG